MTKRMTAWSYSRWAVFNKCRLRARIKFIDKVKEPQSKAADRGNELHEAAENFVGGKVRTFPGGLRNFEDELQDLKKRGASVEEPWVFDDRFRPQPDWDWFDKRVWCRVKVDATHTEGTTLIIVDYKTGKKYDDHAEQAELYAVAGLLWNPKAKRVRIDFYYLDQQFIDEYHMTREESRQIYFPKWNKRGKQVTREYADFAATPGKQCKWCHYRQGRKSLCPY